MWINDSLANGTHQSSTENHAEDWGGQCVLCARDLLIHRPLDLSHRAVQSTVPSMLFGSQETGVTLLGNPGLVLRSSYTNSVCFLPE